ncbi:MAG TPA: hypothetical protein VER14_06460 [Phototrophicaceae bacterium]|nr:hypothetical protein [Phototrophicaceae bacterium]
MDKISDSEDDTKVIHNVESSVLDRLSSKHDTRGDTSTSIGELIQSIDTTMSPLLDQAIEDLIAQSLIQSHDGEHYQITPDGTSEPKNRKRGAIPL